MVSHIDWFVDIEESLYPWDKAHLVMIHDLERVTGRKARGLQTEEIGCKCQTFLSVLSGRRKQTSDIYFSSLYKFKRRFLLTCCVAKTPDFTRS